MMKTNRQPNVDQAIDYYKRLITPEQRMIQLDAWIKDIGETFVNKVLSKVGK